MFFNSEQFPLIAQNLDPRKPEQNRLRAIQQLLSIPAGDPQAADHWVDIRRYLLSAFKDPNEKIAVKFQIIIFHILLKLKLVSLRNFVLSCIRVL